MTRVSLPDYAISSYWGFRLGDVGVPFHPQSTSFHILHMNSFVFLGLYSGEVGWCFLTRDGIELD